MDNKKFMKWFVDNKKIVSVSEACGAGAQKTIDFLKKHLGYKTIKKVTTKSITYCDNECNGIDAIEFERLKKDGLIIGRYHNVFGSENKIGYGYRLDDIMSNLDRCGKVIITPSVDDLISDDYAGLGTIDKVGLGFKSEQGVFDAATVGAGISSGDVIEAALRTSLEDTAKLEKYARESGDHNFYLQYVDGYSQDSKDAWKLQMTETLQHLGYNPDDFKREIELSM